MAKGRKGFITWNIFNLEGVGVPSQRFWSEIGELDAGFLEWYLGESNTYSIGGSLDRHSWCRDSSEGYVVWAGLEVRGALY